MIHFEVDGKSYAIDAADLAGVAAECPFVSYPGLPAGVCGIVQWSGRIFPVISPFSGATLNPGECTFLFSVDNLQGPFSEVAVAIPAQVRAWFPETVPPETSQLSVSELVAQTCAPANEVKKRAA